MKRRIATLLVFALTVTSLLTGCGNTSADLPERTEAVATVAEPTATPEPTEAPHEHTYTEAVTAEATCETDGVKTFSCECGDSYTEAIPATGHSFTNYVYNEDATYTADGTETAKCDNCDGTDTRTAEGTMLTYTFNDMSATKYAKGAVEMAKPKAVDWLQDEKLIILEGWARDGLTDEQIAENMGISARTLYRWKDKYCQICQSLKKGKEAADRKCTF